MKEKKVKPKKTEKGGAVRQNVGTARSKEPGIAWQIRQLESTIVDMRKRTMHFPVAGHPDSKKKERLNR
jgi:hypothetical protein